MISLFRHGFCWFKWWLVILYIMLSKRLVGNHFLFLFIVFLLWLGRLEALIGLFGISQTPCSYQFFSPCSSMALVMVMSVCPLFRQSCSFLPVMAAYYGDLPLPQSWPWHSCPPQDEFQYFWWSLIFSSSSIIGSKFEFIQYFDFWLNDKFPLA